MSWRGVGAEFVGTVMFLVAIVGSGVVTSVGGPQSTQLFHHAVIVGAMLAALILALGPISGAHFNPAVTFADAALGGISKRLAGAYVLAQLVGAVVGVALANFVFGHPIVQVAEIERLGVPLVASEALATFGLLFVIFATVGSNSSGAVAAAAGTYITAAIFATPSTSFANPAVTISRLLTPTWTGIAPNSVLPFLFGQAIGTVAAIVVTRFMLWPTRDEARPAIQLQTEKGSP
ncbi:MAG TPA: aquaporin [Acidimicrobiia bacterium]|nr:aquaporin [Acidimicrobiia bacterium]